MTATVHLLHAQPVSPAAFLRVGHTGHRKLEALHAAGRLPYKRVVFDAAHLAEQAELLTLFRRSGYEIVLDPNFAEMAEIGRFTSAVSKLPWANIERPWEVSDFGRLRNLDLAKLIVEFAVVRAVNAILAPTHLIETAESTWRSIDLNMCEALRNELDRQGGSQIAIDYQIITTSALLRDEYARKQLISSTNDLPAVNVWLRASGFGADATGSGTKLFIEAARTLHEINRPLVVDVAGGYASLAALAFGAVGGISHGVAQKESFKAGHWKRPSSGGGGTAHRVYVHELDRYFNVDQLNAIFGTKGGRSRFGCNDASCCPNGIEDMIENAHAHFITQRSRQISDISSVPDSRRAEHFLLRHIDPAIRSARHAVKLKVADQKTAKAVADAKSRLIRLRDALANLHEKDSGATRSRMPAFRGGRPIFSAAMGR